MRANAQAQRKISDPMFPFCDLLDCINLKIFCKSWRVHNLLLASFCKGQHVYKSRGYSFRILWRWRHPAPPLLAGMSKTARLSAQISHLALYAAMILLPLTGWFAFTEHVRRSLGVASANLFWLAKIPLLPDFGINFHFIHKWGGKAALALIALHVLAALKHHFF